MNSAGIDRRRWVKLLPWLIAVLSAQAFVALTRDRAIASLAPIGSAQGDLLQTIYGLSERWSALGWLGFWHGLPATSTAATVLGSIVEVYGGGGRIALLLPSLILLLASELAFVAAALRLTRSPSLAALGLGLLLCRTRPFLAGTGLFTVNTEWPAACAFGIVASLMIAPPSRDRLVGSLASVALGLVILSLSTTAFASLLVIVALRIVTSHDLFGSKALKTAAVLMLVAVSAILLLISDRCPPLPVTGIRLEHDHVARCGYGLRTSLLYFVSFGLGLKFVVAALAGLGAGLGAAMMGCRDLSPRRIAPGRGREAFFLAGSLIALAFIQMVQHSADPIGSGLLDIPLTALLLVVLASLPRIRRGGSLRWSRFACFSFMALCPLLTWGSPLLDAPPPTYGGQSGAAEVISWLLNDAEQNERPRARILVASSLQFIDSLTLSAFFFETFGEPADFTVATVESGDIGSIDYAVLPARDNEGKAGSDLLKRLGAAMVLRARLDTHGLDLAIYSVPNIAVTGVSGGWLLDHGTLLRFDAKEIPAGNVIALRGPDGYANYIPEAPSATATATLSTGTTLRLPARFVREADTYTIFVDPETIEASGVRRIDIALEFSAFFVPKELGLNPDPRHLTVMAPTSVGLAARAAAFGQPGTTP